jgi:NTP pyrophosphatase (non-canonical NTP hydrolase)
MSEHRADGELTTLRALRDRLHRFAQQRDWEKFHSPKNLAMALSVEVAELMEHFQWVSEAASSRLSPEQLAEVRHELADVLIYLVRLADKLDVDLLAAASDKMVLNAAKYPAHKARGNSRKYTKL